MKKVLKVLFFLVILVISLLSAAYVVVREGNQKLADLRGHGNVLTESFEFHESAKYLSNPNRGFYYIHGFKINDEKTDYRENISDRFCKDEETNLAMIQFNLQYYRDKDISQAGLENLEALFGTLQGIDKQLIVRFLYDWDGENEQVEPENIAIILRHMEQVSPFLEKYHGNIFVTQGLFIGNWGEMNGTKYNNAKDVKTLAEKLVEVTTDKTYLSVRMPMFWRMATGLGDSNTVKRGDGTLASRMGLYNDGMLGSWSDYGTYGEHTRAEHGDFTYWNREEELTFQEELCKLVPNGGEVIIDNSYNDWENALKDLRRMHVTYLNKDFDQNVYKKWAKTKVDEVGCFQNMDGLTYVERHLGYRFVIKDTALRYQYKEDLVTVEVQMANVGFAPLYKEAEVRVNLYQPESGELLSYKVDADLRELAGGNDAQEIMSLVQQISMTGRMPQSYIVYLEITDTASGQSIYLGNEEEPSEYGYQIGVISLEPDDAETYYGENEWCEKLFHMIPKE